MTPEQKTYQEKLDFYTQKIGFTKQRTDILTAIIASGEETPLQDNTYELEILSLRASLESLEHYWNHYNTRLEAMKKNEEAVTEECEANFDEYQAQINNIKDIDRSLGEGRLREHYERVRGVHIFQNQEEKNDTFVLMKEFLNIYTKTK